MFFERKITKGMRIPKSRASFIPAVLRVKCRVWINRKITGIMYASSIEKSTSCNQYAKFFVFIYIRLKLFTLMINAQGDTGYEGKIF